MKTLLQFFIFLFCLCPFSLAQDQQAKAKQLQKDGNFKDALVIYLELLESGKQDGALENLKAANQCAGRLKSNEFDIETLRGILEKQPENWQLIPTAVLRAEVIFSRFRKADDENPTNRFEWLRWYEKAMPFAEKAVPEESKAAGEFWMAFAQRVSNRGAEPWKLHSLTDYENPPIEEPQHRRWGVFVPPAAAVGEDGKPLFHEIPESYAAAKTDGERWRWLQERAAKADSKLRNEIDFLYAEFLERQFSVTTTGQRFDPDRATKNPLYAWHLLAEEECVARLATGVSGVRLPPGHRFLELYKKVGDSDEKWVSRAWGKVARIYQHRGRFAEAATIWKKIADAETRAKVKENHLAQRDQILGNWIGFQPGKLQPAGDPAMVSVFFRNVKSVSFSARRIDLQKLIKDTKSYLKSDPDHPDRELYDMNNLTNRMRERGGSFFEKIPAIQWSDEIEPLPNHWNSKAELETPLTEPGAYWVTADVKDGNSAHQIVWISDTIIVRRDVDGGEWYFVADAKTGEPIAGAKVEVFGYRTESKTRKKFVQGKLKRDYYTKIDTRENSKKSDKNGVVIYEAGVFNGGGKNFNRLVSATTKDGRMALSGFERFWGWHKNPDYKSASASPVKAFLITDRPVYRPGQTVKFKAWVRESKYGGREWSKFAGDRFKVTVLDGRGEKVFEEKMKADAFAGIQWELPLAEEATLGQYSVRFQENDDTHVGMANFRVEEYKKPEFEVTVEAPDEAIALGEKFKAKVTASYYFGAPVTSGTVKYTVKRNEQDVRWFPNRPWDWLYGRGYGWFASDAAWYPGWDRWGCYAPRWSWGGWVMPQPEVVASGEVEIGADGTAEIEIETANAKVLHGNTDHRYDIEIEVTDESRRMIKGSGSVTAARKPFEVFAWVNRGFYNNNEQVTATFRAQNADGKPIAGTGVMTLFEIKYKADGEPDETKIEEWKISPDKNGDATKTFPAGASGQYRIAWEVTDNAQHTETGAALFTVRGEKNDPANFRYSALELIANAAEYAVGETAEILVASDHANAPVMLFVRPVNGVSLKPIFARLPEKSEILKVKVSEKDQPNFFVDALTVRDGKVHAVTREIIVPPKKQVLEVTVAPAKKEAKPGEETKVVIRLTDREGKPFEGTGVISIYDKAVEYISGGSNVPEIRKHFWGWKRNHRASNWNTFNRSLSGTWPDDERMFPIVGSVGRSFLSGAAVLSGGNPSNFAFVAPGSSGSHLTAGLRSGGNALNADSIDGLISEAAGGVFSKSAVAAPAAMMFGKTRDSSVTAADFAATAEVAPVAVRTKFADTALWSDSVITNSNGEATVSLAMPENLSTWKVKAWAMGHGTVVGEGEAEIITSKKLLIRQQAPRFFVERDEVTLSANVHNYLTEPQTVTVSLELDGAELGTTEGETLVREIKLEPNGEQRVDWKIAAKLEGEAVIRMKALAAGESDAVEVSYPVLVHGALRTEAWSQIIKPEMNSAQIKVNIPADRRPEQTRLEVRYSPSIAAAMVDALPYLADFPYGCTEQTLSRFLPSAITQNVLKDLDIGLDDIRNKTANFNAGELGEAKERAAQWERYRENPIFSEARLNRMVRKGVNRLQSMQNPNGGWGWFSGGKQKSYPHTTAWTVRGLLIAGDNGLTIDKSGLGRGVIWLSNYQKAELARLELPNDHKKKKGKADALDALVACVVSRGRDSHEGMLNHLFDDRIDLPVYAKSLAGIAFHNAGQKERVDMILQNIEQHLKRDEENQTAWLELGNQGYWWHWYGSEIEAHAFYLKLLTLARPESDVAPAIVKWLLNNRKNGSYWASTRDTALCIEAIGDYLRVSGETAESKTVIVLVDGVEKKRVTIDKKSLFDFDDRLVLEGAELDAGEHNVEIRREGRGPLYVNAYLTNFTKEDDIKAAGLDVKVQRRFFKLTPKADAKALAETAVGTASQQNVEAFDRIEIKKGDAVESGDLVEVELKVITKNDAEYLIVEDPKAAGFEPLEFTSGFHYGKAGEIATYREFRDERVAHFVRSMPQGEHIIRYRTRAEIPGKFHALPAKAEAMYAPELVGSSDEQTLLIR